MYEWNFLLGNPDINIFDLSFLGEVDGLDFHFFLVGDIVE